MKRLTLIIFAILVMTNIVYPQDIINEMGAEGKFIVRDSEQQEALIIDEGDVSITGALKIEHLLEGSDTDGIVVWDSESKSLKVVPRVFNHRSPLSKPLDSGSVDYSVMDPVLPGDGDDPNDFVISDDLIIDGSECVGFDCVDGESFGFDTIRLKENNLRIRFQDTSVSGSFPTNDWVLEANSSSNGGTNHFAIVDEDGGRTPFKVYAGAPTSSLSIRDNGNVGFGINLAVVELHSKDGDTPTLRLEQDGSSGFTPQTWDMAGNETNFFIRDVTNGSTLPFRIRPGAPTSSLEIGSTGNIGIGTSTPDFPLDIQPSSSGAAILLRESDGDLKAINFKSLSNRGEMLLYHDGAPTTKIAGLGNNYFNGNVGIGTETPTSKLSVVGIDAHSDNAAAIAAGKSVGDLYRTGDFLKIVH